MVHTYQQLLLPRGFIAVVYYIYQPLLLPLRQIRRGGLLQLTDVNCEGFWRLNGIYSGKRVRVGRQHEGGRSAGWALGQ
jgi:hypothetical protein